MNQTISPGARTGSVRIPASKSQAHRLLICAALGAQPVRAARRCAFCCRSRGRSART